MVVIIVQGSSLKVGEFEGLRVFDMGKAFELGRVIHWVQGNMGMRSLWRMLWG